MWGGYTCVIYPPWIRWEFALILKAYQGLVPSVNRRLYVSHFLSAWNSRIFEFGAMLFLAAIFPNSLREMSIYALVRACSAIVLAPAVGNYIDSGNRLRVLTVSIGMQDAPPHPNKTDIRLTCICISWAASGCSSIMCGLFGLET